MTYMEAAKVQVSFSGRLPDERRYVTTCGGVGLSFPPQTPPTIYGAVCGYCGEPCDFPGAHWVEDGKLTE